MDLTAMLGASFVGAFLYAFTTLLPVINPFSGAMFFVTLTGHLSDADRSYVAGRIAVFSLIILMVCLFAGHIILGFLVFPLEYFAAQAVLCFLPQAGMP